MPAMHYPIYRLTTPDPTWAGYWEQWTSLPFWPSAHLWFLWCLLILDFVAAGLFSIVPRLPEQFGHLSRSAKEAPLRFFAALLGISAFAYVPLSMKFSVWEWASFGPFAVQPSFMPLYVVYFFAGIAIGAPGLETGLFSHDGKFAQRWVTWTGFAVGGFFLWIAATALTMQPTSAQLRSTELAASMGFAIASTGACLALPAAFLRFATEPTRILFRLGDNALGIYFFHLFFILWLHYFLLNLPLFAFIKFLIVFTGSLALSWAAALAASRAVLGSRIFVQRSLTTSGVGDSR
jgi:hypothetical protein